MASGWGRPQPGAMPIQGQRALWVTLVIYMALRYECISYTILCVVAS